MPATGQLAAVLGEVVAAAARASVAQAVALGLQWA